MNRNPKTHNNHPKTGPTILRLLTSPTKLPSSSSLLMASSANSTIKNYKVSCYPNNPPESASRNRKWETPKHHNLISESLPSSKNNSTVKRNTNAKKENSLIKESPITMRNSTSVTKNRIQDKITMSIKTTNSLYRVLGTPSSHSVNNTQKLSSASKLNTERSIDSSHDKQNALTLTNRDSASESSQLKSSKARPPCEISDFPETDISTQRQRYPAKSDNGYNIDQLREKFSKKRSEVLQVICDLDSKFQTLLTENEENEQIPCECQSHTKNTSRSIMKPSKQEGTVGRATAEYRNMNIVGLFQSRQHSKDVYVGQYNKLRTLKKYDI